MVIEARLGRVCTSAPTTSLDKLLSIIKLDFVTHRASLLLATNRTEHTNTRVLRRINSSIRLLCIHMYVRKTWMGMLKFRVAPVKRQSLPKLELCGAHLLASLYAKIKDVFTDQPLSSYFWTDSQLVLHWLQQHSITLSTFVGNRVSDIQELTVGGHWRYVPTRENPADLVSRGCPTAELKQSNWFSGPAFLFQDQTKWPNQKPPVDLDGDVINSEKRKTTLTTMMETNYILNIINGISSYPHCLRLVAWLFRFCDSSRKKSKFTTASPSPDELRRASHCLIWNIQQHHFSVDFQLLKKNRSLKSNLKFLTPFIDTSTGYELIKVGGRLDYTELPDSQKHPLLLPSNSQFILTYVRHLHLRNYHAGPKP